MGSRSRPPAFPRGGLVVWCLTKTRIPEESPATVSTPPICWSPSIWRTARRISRFVKPSCGRDWSTFGRLLPVFPRLLARPRNIRLHWPACNVTRQSAIVPRLRSPASVDAGVQNPRFRPDAPTRRSTAPARNCFGRGWLRGTTTPARTWGSKPRIRYWPLSRGMANALMVQDPSWRRSTQARSLPPPSPLKRGRLVDSLGGHAELGQAVPAHDAFRVDHHDAPASTHQGEGNRIRTAACS